MRQMTKHIFKRAESVITDLKPMKGKLAKFNANVFSDTFDERYVELKDCKFYYYEGHADVKEMKLKGCLNFDIYDV
jgi:hypothetical protein